MTSKLLVWLRAWQVNLEETLAAYFGQWEERPVLAQLLESCLTLLNQPLLANLDMRAENAFVEMVLGRILQQVDNEKSNQHLAISLYLYRSLNDRFRTAQVLGEQGANLFFGEDKPGEAYSLMQESLALVRQIGDPEKIVDALSGLAYPARALLKFDEIAALSAEAYAIVQSANNHSVMLAASNIMPHLGAGIF